jgi:hypothetical protein
MKIMSLSPIYYFFLFANGNLRFLNTEGQTIYENNCQLFLF